MTDYTINQLVDLAQVRQLLESHHRLSGMAYGLFDTEENNLIAVGWQDICIRFHRANPVTCARCRESDAFIKAHLHDAPGDLLEYRCKNNMIDIAMPIIIDGEHLATFFTGQFFYDDAPPDRDFFIQQAAELGFDTEDYLNALDRVPLFSHEHIRGNVLFLHNMVQILAESGLKNLRLAREMEERKRAEEASRASEAQYRRIVDTANEGIWALGLDTRTTFVNARMAEMLGYSCEEMDGRPFTDFIFEEDMPDHLNRLKRRQRGLSETYERRFRRKDGQTVWTLASAAPIFDDGHCFIGSFAMFTDITERKLAEMKLGEWNKTLERRVEEEVAKNREKDHILIQQSRLAAMGEMVHNIAHQWRQPLNALSIILSNIKDDYDFQELTPESLDKIVKRAHEILQRMSTTVDDFRDFFMPDREPGEFELSQSVEDALFVIEAALENNNIEVEKDLTTGLVAYGYSNQFAQAILNILANAKEAIQHCMTSGGRINIRLRRSKGQGTLVIEDNGGGIPDDILPKIFDPYFTTKDKGSGIGLYMSKMIIERNLNGKIEAANAGQGALITVTLPLMTKSTL